MNIFTIMPAWIRIPDRIIVDIRIPIQPLNAGRDNRIRLGEASNGGVVIELRTKKYQPHKLAHARRMGMDWVMRLNCAELIMKVIPELTVISWSG